MTWIDPGHLPAAGFALVLGALAGWFVPRLIAAVPEPAPEPVADTGATDVQEASPEAAAEEPKELYADIAARPGLAWQCSVASALSAAVIGASLGWAWTLLFWLPLAPIGVALALVDARTRLLPTRIVRPTHLVVLVLAGITAAAEHDAGPYLRAVALMVVMRWIFWVMWWIHSAGMGFGDVRLSALLGFALGYLGWQETAAGIYAAFVLFVVPGLLVALVRWDRRFLRARIPFGPFLLLGALLGVATGPALMGSLGY